MSRKVLNNNNLIIFINFSLLFKKFFFLFLFKKKKKKKMSRQEKIFKTAQANIGETVWAKSRERQAKRKSTVLFSSNEWKCNLFVYEVILASGYDIGTPNKLNYLKHPVLAVKGKLDRPPCTSDWYAKKVPGMDFIGEGNEGKLKCIPGDIITDGTHMGIIAGNNQTISANENKIVQNNWGFRSNENKPVRIFRCNK